MSYTKLIRQNQNSYTQFAYNKFSSKGNYAKAFGDDEKDHYDDYRVRGNFIIMVFVLF